MPTHRSFANTYPDQVFGHPANHTAACDVVRFVREHLGDVQADP
jgi:hypothetical protein